MIKICSVISEVTSNVLQSTCLQSNCIQMAYILPATLHCETVATDQTCYFDNFCLY